ncbi:MAG: DHH family phosphoesterase [Spirochaetes bacterium]|nr:DHH family phosphoesterase [Spirochaetota bacterium]MBN2771819.1 DHH family phosphoesterase [Spirochaetota bacterium]
MNKLNYKEIKTSLLNIFHKYNNLLIVIQGSPDPDAIASSFFLMKMAQTCDCSCTVIAGKTISLPQNRELISKLNITLNHNYPEDFDEYDGYCVVDYQNPAVENIPSQVPCVLHIDHHTRAESSVNPEYSLYPEDVNSVSTVLAGVLLQQNDLFDDKIRQQIATALAYGIKTDTDNLTIASTTDKEAFSEMEKIADKEILDLLDNMPYSEETLTLISKAMLNSTNYKSWLISGLGFIPETLRDSLAITADYMLEQENVTTVIAFALITSENSITLDASFRTKNSELDLNGIIKSITPDGGGRSFKGAFQLDLSYFAGYPEKHSLWSIVNESTLINIKKARDNISFYEVRTFFTGLKKQLSDIFHR